MNVMKSYLIPGLLSGFILLGLSVALLFMLVSFMPHLAEEYYNPVFRSEDDRNWMFYAHPFILSFALAWFWHRFKVKFKGNWVMRGLELGVVYIIVAILPTMWLTFSAIDVNSSMVLTWIGYGFFQSVVAGWLFAKTNP